MEAAALQEDMPCLPATDHPGPPPPGAASHQYYFPGVAADIAATAPRVPDQRAGAIKAPAPRPPVVDYTRNADDKQCTAPRATPGEVSPSPAALEALSAKAAVKRLSGTSYTMRQATQALNALSKATGRLTQLHHGNFAAAVYDMADDYLGPHLDVDKIKQAAAGADRLDDLLAMAAGGLVPPTRQAPVNNAARLQRGNLHTALLNSAAVFERLLIDAGLGRVALVPISMAEDIVNLIVGPVGVVDQGDKKRMFNHHSYSGWMPDGSPDLSVNDRTDSAGLPPCDIGTVFFEICLAAYALRQRYPDKVLLGRKIDIKDAFRQLLMHPAYAPMFAYRWGENLVLDLRLSFGWKGSPGYFQAFINPLTDWIKSRRPSDYPEETRPSLGPLMVDDVVVRGDPKALRQLPPDPDIHKVCWPEAEGNAPFHTAKAYLDDVIALELAERAGAMGGAMYAGAKLFFGEEREGYPPCVVAKKFAPWDTSFDLLGVDINLNDLTLSLPAKKVERLLHMLNVEWPPERTEATPRDIMRLCGRLRAMSLCVRPGRYFLRRIIDNVKVYYQRGCTLDTTINLMEGLHADLAVWRALVNHPELLRDEFAMPLYNHVKRKPAFLVVGDAMAISGGGLVACEHFHVWWKVMWPPDVQQQFQAMERKECKIEEAVTMAQFELAVVVLGVGLLVEEAQRRNVDLWGASVLALADNSNAVSWMRKCGARNEKAGELMRIYGMKEAEARCSTLTDHLPGVDNEAGDYISRHSFAESKQFMSTYPSPISHTHTTWTQVQPTDGWVSKVFSALGSSSLPTH